MIHSLSDRPIEYVMAAHEAVIKCCLPTLCNLYLDLREASLDGAVACRFDFAGLKK